MRSAHPAGGQQSTRRLKASPELLERITGGTVQVIGGLCFCVFSEYLSLKRAYEEDRDRGSSLLAWRARNLLELSVWSIYSAKGRENARRLYRAAECRAIG